MSLIVSVCCVGVNMLVRWNLAYSGLGLEDNRNLKESVIFHGLRAPTQFEKPRPLATVLLLASLLHPPPCSEQYHLLIYPCIVLRMTQKGHQKLADFTCCCRNKISKIFVDARHGWALLDTRWWAMGTAPTDSEHLGGIGAVAGSNRQQ